MSQVRPARIWARRLLLVVCLAVLAASGIWFFRYWQQNRRTQESVDKLRNIVREADRTSAESGEPDQGFAALKAENPDFAGWISIPGTAVDYPVMLPPADQPEYYLRRSFQKEYDINGIPFLDARCVLDPPSGNFIIYGHNMYSGVMFHDLLSYRKQAFWEEHPLISFETMTHAGTYEIIGVFLYDASSGEDAFKPHADVDFADEAAFDDYMDQVRAAAYYETGVEPVYGRQILTLVTCDRSVLSNGRLIVVAQETEESGAEA